MATWRPDLKRKSRGRCSVWVVELEDSCTKTASKNKKMALLPMSYYDVLKVGNDVIIHHLFKKCIYMLQIVILYDSFQRSWLIG